MDSRTEHGRALSRRRPTLPTGHMSLSSQPLLSAALADQTVESLYAMHGRRRPWIYWISLTAVGAAVGVLPLLQVDVTVRSAGMVRPASERAEIKSALGVHVERVWAHDTEQVEAGSYIGSSYTKSVARWHDVKVIY